METTAVNELPGGKPYFYYRLKKDFPIQSRQTHWRGYPQLVHLRDGMLEVWLNCQKYTLSAGDVLYIAAGTLISWQLMGAELDVLVFDPARFTRLPNSQDISFSSARELSMYTGRQSGADRMPAQLYRGADSVVALF